MCSLSMCIYLFFNKRLNDTVHKVCHALLCVLSKFNICDFINWKMKTKAKIICKCLTKMFMMFNTCYHGWGYSLLSFQPNIRTKGCPWNDSTSISLSVHTIHGSIVAPVPQCSVFVNPLPWSFVRDPVAGFGHAGYAIVAPPRPCIWVRRLLLCRKGKMGIWVHKEIWHMFFVHKCATCLSPLTKNNYVFIIQYCESRL